MKLQLTISLLVSDRKETLKRCLDSIVPLLKEVSSELIIVFTGKDESVLEIARQYTSHIIPFTWCDDFAKARNAGLEEAGGEWFLYLDDDEWFENVDEIIEFFKSGEYRSYETASYVQRNYDDWEGRFYNDAQVGRMCHLTENIRFVSPIHEGLYPFEDPRKILKSYVHHYGYVESGSASEGRKKFERNSALLRKVYKENPNAHICMQLAQEYRYVNEEETAIEYCREGLRLAEKEERIYIYEMWMQVHLPVMLSAIGKKEEALAEGEKILLSPRLLEVGQAHIHSILATLCWDLKECQKGLRHVRNFHKTMRYLEKHPEKATRQNGGSVTYTTAWEHAMPAYVAGLLFSAELGETGQLREILAWIPWDREKLVESRYTQLEQLKAAYPELRDVILDGYSRLQTNNAYVNLQKALHAEEKHLPVKAERYFAVCAGNCPSGFMHQIVKMAERNGFALTPLLERTSVEIWDAYVKALPEQMEAVDMPDFMDRLCPLMSDFPIYAERLKQSLLEKLLSQGMTETARLLELLRSYCGSVRKEAETLYRAEILEITDYYALPSRYKFVFMAEKVLADLEAGKYEECISMLRDAIHTYPQMSGAISCLSDYMEEKMKEPPKVSEEFQVLGKQVKQVLQGLVANEQWGEAYGVADQLLALLPGDLEVLKLKQEIIRHMS